MIIKSDLKDLVIPPTMLSFITTNKCTAACRNCCFKCNPKNNERLSLEVIKKHIDTALSSFTSIKVLILTGGECFTLGDDLFSVIDYGAKKGLITRVVSNAYWAMTFKRTYNMISKLKQSGLSELNVSTGDEHLEWISLDNIVNVIIASIKLNFTVVINIESSELKNFNKQMLLNDIRLKKYDIDNCDNVHIFNGRWIYFNNEKKENVKKKNVLVSNISHKRCTSLFSTLTINSNNTVIACCGITSLKNNFLYL